ncbi:MAG: hypothetical protein ABII74_02375 [Elusimicrobiota bacterium]
MSKGKIWGIWLAAFLVLINFAVYAQEEKKATDWVSLSWEEMKKILSLDKDEVSLSWEEFQRLILQTGSPVNNQFTLQNGRVILSRAQFKELLNQMKPPAPPGKSFPKDYLISKAIYQGKVKKDSTVFTATFRLNVFPMEKKAEYVKVPLFPGGAALEEVLVDERSGLVMSEGGQRYLFTNKIGEQLVRVKFSIKSTLEEGFRGMEFAIPETPITILDLVIPLSNSDIEMSSAQQIDLVRKDGLSYVHALLTPTTTVKIRWHKLITEADVSKVPAKIYTEIGNLVKVEEDVLKISAEIKLNVLQNNISLINVKIPAGYNILEVKGEGIADWQVREGKNILEIRLESPRKGEFSFTVAAEKVLPQTNVVADFSGFEVVGSVRERGFVGVELASIAEVKVTEAKDLERMDIKELPPTLINRSNKPLIFAFKYFHHPYNLVLDVQKHQELPVVSTVIDLANGVTLFTKDGKLVHWVVYKVRNTWKQFLEIQLPAEAQLWSVFVGNQPVKPSINQAGKTLIPLNRSQQVGNELTPFDVELIYYQKGQRFSLAGRRETDFPAPDVVISQMLWSVYLPLEYNYLYFGGTVEKEKIARGIRPLLGMNRVMEKLNTYASLESRSDRGGVPPPPTQSQYRYKGWGQGKKAQQEFTDKLGISEQSWNSQVAGEENFEYRVQNAQQQVGQTGVLPIQVQLPVSGQVYRFAKILVSQESMILNFVYLQGGLLSLFQLLIMGLLVALVYFFRRSFGSLGQKIYSKIQPLAQRLGKLGAQYQVPAAEAGRNLFSSFLKLPKIIAMALLFFSFLFFFISSALSAMFFLLAMLLGVYIVVATLSNLKKKTGE